MPDNPERCSAVFSKLLNSPFLPSALAFAFSLFVHQQLHAKGIEVHGFVSQGYLKSTKNNYLAQSKRGSWEFAEAAINLSSDVTDDLSVGLQLFSRELGALGNFNLELDWAFGDFALLDWFNIRVGKIKMPYGLYGETQDFDIVRVSVLLPQSVYYLALRDLLVAFNGLSIYGNMNMDKLGFIDYQIFSGAIIPPRSAESSVAYYFESESYLPQIGIQMFEVTDITNKYLIGASLKWSDIIPGFVLNTSVVHYAAEANAEVAPEFTKTLEMTGTKPKYWTRNLKLTFHNNYFLVLSLQYAWDDLLITSEFARYYALFEMSLAPIIPHSVLDQKRWYLQAEYELNDLMHMSCYYSYLSDLNDQRKATKGTIPAHGAYMKDFAISLRLDLTDSWLLKVEGHLFDGTAQVYSIENKKHTNLERFWTLVAAKTTVTF